MFISPHQFPVLSSFFTPHLLSAYYFDEPEKKVYDKSIVVVDCGISGTRAHWFLSAHIGDGNAPVHVPMLKTIALAAKWRGCSLKSPEEIKRIWPLLFNYCKDGRHKLLLCNRDSIPFPRTLRQWYVIANATLFVTVSLPECGPCSRDEKRKISNLHFGFQYFTDEFPKHPSPKAWSCIFWPALRLQLGSLMRFRGVAADNSRRCHHSRASTHSNTSDADCRRELLPQPQRSQRIISTSNLSSCCFWSHDVSLKNYWPCFTMYFSHLFLIASILLRVFIKKIACA
jgi:hypothetical protein